MKLRKEYTPGVYRRCVRCKFRGQGCDGPRTPAMQLEYWCALMRELKEEMGLTNSDIAEASQLSLKTVEKIITASITDLRFSTMQAIENVLFGTAGTYPCPLELIPDQEDMAAIQRDLAQKNEQIEKLEKAMEGIHASYRAEMDAIRTEAQKKIDYLIKENDRKSAVIDKLLGR